MYEEELQFNVILENDPENSQPVITSMNGYLVMDENILSNQNSVADSSAKLTQVLKAIVLRGQPAGSVVAAVKSKDFYDLSEDKFA